MGCLVRIALRALVGYIRGLIGDQGAARANRMGGKREVGMEER